MANWDEDSPLLRTNLKLVLNKIRASALHRDLPQVAIMCSWQAETMKGLEVPDPKFVGHLRGEPGLENVGVRIGGLFGTPAADVKRQVDVFEKQLQAEVAKLDAAYPDSASLDGNGLVAVIQLSAWAHSEWVRIHPFANGNGRTARMWANFLFMRYGLPPVVQLRPRPGGKYALAGMEGMKGIQEPTEAVFLQMLKDHLSSTSS